MLSFAERVNRERITMKKKTGQKLLFNSVLQEEEKNKLQECEENRMKVEPLSGGRYFQMISSYQMKMMFFEKSGI